MVILYVMEQLKMSMYLLLDFLNIPPTIALSTLISFGIMIAGLKLVLPKRRH